MTLTGIKIVRSRGRRYVYLQRGDRRVRLPDLPHDDPAFLAAYAEAAQRLGAPRASGRPGSIAALIAATRAAGRYLGTSATYRATLARHLDAIADTAGDAPARGLRPAHIRADLARAASPADRLKAWRMAVAVGMDAGLLAEDPTLGVRPPSTGRNAVGHEPWTGDEIAAFRARWPVGSKPRAAMELLWWTGARISDAVRLGPGRVDPGGVLSYRQGKTGGEAFVPWTCALPPYVAGMTRDRDAMHVALRAADEGHLTFLATRQGRTRSSKALGQMIRTAARAAGVAKSAHGLRKARAVALAELGASAHQIAAWTGHATLKEVEHYARRADRRRAVLGADREQDPENIPARTGKHP